MSTLKHITNLRSLKSWRSNPLGIKPEAIQNALDAFDAGYLRDAVNLWEYIEQRDDLLRTVISKRKKAVARHGWTVLTKPNLSTAQKHEAEEHVAALEYFYNHLECEHAVDAAEKGGFKLLARQMMDAVGKRFAFHEIIWRPESMQQWREGARAGRATDRRLVSASFRFVPLAFFENTTGALRFLGPQSSLEGRPLEPGAWLVTVGEGLMFASAAAWSFKTIGLGDWLTYSQANARPTLRGVTTAAVGSAEWEQLEESLGDLISGQPSVHANTEDVQIVDLTGGDGIPFQRLVERVDRMLAAIWRGADLSTLSRDRGYGASLQEKESCVLEEDDAEMLTEALHRYVDEWVIRHVFGEDVKPLASVKVLISPRECTTHDLQVDEFLLRHGAPLSLEATLHRYGRTAARPGEKVFTPNTTTSTRPESPHETTPGRGGERSSAELGNLEPAVFPGESQPLALANEPGAGRERQANECASASRPRGEDGPFTILQPDWVQLSPYGDFPHTRGLQRVDRDAAESMVAAFESFLGKASRLFGGVPFYAGHPDLPGASDHADQKAYGWITKLEARADGLFGLAKWSDAGRELLRQAHYKYLSPYWEATEIGRENGRKIFRPIALISVGLTNQPNIPVRPLANDAGRGSPEPHEPIQENATTLLVNEVIEAALLSGRITPAHETEWREALQNDLPGARGRLQALGCRMHTQSSTGDLGTRRSELTRMANRGDRIQEAVARKQKLGLSYDAAWQSVKREHPGWFE